MPTNELRKDYLLNRWAVIAVERKRRPTDFVKEPEEKKAVTCPFCPGNERMTPPAILVYVPSNGDIKKEKDQNGFRHKNWLIRCFSNLYPAFSPIQNGEIKKADSVFMNATGHHEVLVESPRHDEHPGVARISQLVYLINAYLDRLSEISAETYTKYVSIFRNHKRDAGASLSHAHSQLISTPLVPRIVSEELKASKSFWTENKRCIFCEILGKEKNSPRFIWENNGFVAFAPWASIHPFEFWIFPKRHQSTLLDMSRVEIKDLAMALRVCLGGLKSLLRDPPYNFGFHIAASEEDSDYYHWHLEVYPKLSIWAGFEKSTGMFINVVPPEDAAENLREAVKKEEKIV
ncbi:galactose-1-phosphate uridylyltransferase [Candidatus Bathyarchaeota archaeon]|nr:MAG: galactose-1-phosphate uridylyltransferase [Candidatus Bathyarchaeota archaeon]